MLKQRSLFFLCGNPSRLAFCASLIITQTRNKTLESVFRCELDIRSCWPCELKTGLENVSSKNETTRIVKFGLFFTSSSLQFTHSKQVNLWRRQSSQVTEVSQIGLKREELIHLNNSKLSNVLTQNEGLKLKKDLRVQLLPHSPNKIVASVRPDTPCNHSAPWIIPRRQAIYVYHFVNQLDPELNPIGILI